MTEPDYYLPSSRQLQVLMYAATGLSAEEIGARLHLSAETVRTHLRKLYAKWGARNRAHAVHIAYSTGILTPKRIAHLEPIELSPHLGACNACRAPVLWSRTASRRAVAVSIKPVPDGRVMLAIDRRELRAVLLDDERAVEALGHGAQLHRFHVTDCLDPQRHVRETESMPEQATRRE